MSDTLLAIDLGGTQIRAAVVDVQGQLLSRARASTPADEGPGAVIAQIVETARAAIADAPGATPRAIGLSAPGPIDPRSGLVFAAPNMVGWTDVPLGERVSESLSLPTFAGNDANLAALGEWKFGAGRGRSDLVYLTVSTGIGSGVISGGRLISGKRGLAVEAGHMILEPNGPACGCGSFGCLEALAAGPAIARQAEIRLSKGEPSSLASDIGHITARMVEEAALAGDRLAAEVFLRAATYVGIGCANLINLFDPEKIIIGGGVSHAGELLFGPVRATALARCMPELGKGVEIIPAELQDDVGLLGAAAYAFEIIRSPRSG